ncbi:MAG TPA: PAS domain S-box protein [Candidatus Acidoferrales bacterium]|jgi:PAS domain S-box-containing protein|nr:PAS domain S-box protein [Candidatus Acidoferrales bacterium]
MRYEAAQSVLDGLDPAQAEAVLLGLAQVFLDSSGSVSPAGGPPQDTEAPNLEAQYRTLIEQIPAVVFMVYLDRGVGEAYVSPQIETMLGFSREEWLEDPVRWYQSIHPDDKLRWSAEAAEMFLSGRPLRSVYRVIARDGHVVYFHCNARMVRRHDGRPWFIHGVGFDITDLKRAEEALQEERNFASAVLDTVGALVLVLDPHGRIVRFNRACERTTGYASSEVVGGHMWDLFVAPEETARFREMFEQLRAGRLPAAYESAWATRQGARRAIAWSSTVLAGARGALEYVILTGIDVTEAKRLERTILDISGREQRRIGQDLHDGLGQHLTGVAFMSKVLEQKLREKSLPEAEDAAKIVALVNQAVNRTRELSHGLLPVLSDARGLMAALERLALEVEDLFQLSCRFECDQPVLIRQSDIATHLYHIAQEAVNNAIKHGQPRRIVIRLAGGSQGSSLRIDDDGVGVRTSPGRQERGAQGMGLLIMSYRAKMIGGALEVRPGPDGGTTVCCTFSASNLE